MAHGAPLSRSEGGVTGPYMIEAVSPRRITLRSFWLTDTSLEASAKMIKRGLPPLFGFLGKTTRTLRIRRAISADARANVAKFLSLSDLESAHFRSVVKRSRASWEIPLVELRKRNSLFLRFVECTLPELAA